VRAGSKLLAVSAAVLLAFGPAGCGDGDDSGQTTTETSSQDRSEGGSASSGASKDFIPTEHEDSGGGSAQFRIEGGDNSIQEFGEEADADEFEAAAAALHDFLDARAAADWDSVCAVVSEEVSQSLEKIADQATKQLDDASCAGILAALTNPAAKKILEEEATQADVASLRIEGDRGYAIYRATKGDVFAIPMAKVDGEWKVAGLAGTPIA